MVVRVVFHDSSSPLKENIFVRSVRILQLAWMFTKDYGGSFLLAWLLRCLMERVRCYREEIFYASNKTYCRQFLFFENGKRPYFISFFFFVYVQGETSMVVIGGGKEWPPFLDLGFMQAQIVLVSLFPMLNLRICIGYT